MGNAEKSCYMSFDISGGECRYYPIIIRITPLISVEVMKEIDNAIQDKIKQYVEKQEYWDIDEILIDEVVMEIATKYDFDFEFVEINYCVDRA